MRIQLSEHFTYNKLIRFVLPSILMMIFTSVYTIVDGLFVSNYVGKTPFAALNLIYPVLMAIGTLGFMIGTGGSALVAKTLGEGKRDAANRYFSMLVGVTVAGGIVLTILGQLFIPSIARLLGAADDMLDYCVLYARILLLSQTFFMLQNVFQSFFVVAEKPKLGLLMVVVAGLTNVVFDYLFVAVFRWGLAGAAAATAASQLAGGGAPILYFLRKNKSLLRLVKARPDARVIAKACTNGVSELMTNLSASLVNILYNFQLMRLEGENGVAAYGTIMYVSFIFMAIYFGYSLGSAPVISYHYGAGNQTELRSLFHKSLVLLSIVNVALTVLAAAFAAPLSGIFVGYDKELLQITVRGMQLFSIAFLVMGINVFGSAFFTALNNGFISALISFLRTFVFQTLVVLILPVFLGLDGVWLAIVAAEVLALAVTAACFWRKQKEYHY